MESLRPLAVEKIGAELAVAWSDGRESFIGLEALRRRCPCAACAGEPDVTGRVIVPRVNYGAGSFELMSWQMVGGYAIQPRWGDGHSSGLFTYTLLREIG